MEMEPTLFLKKNYINMVLSQEMFVSAQDHFNAVLYNCPIGGTVMYPHKCNKQRRKHKATV